LFKISWGEVEDKLYEISDGIENYPGDTREKISRMFYNLSMNA
jgi:hypothetical protein